jgi:hypothetical protein
MQFFSVVIVKMQSGLCQDGQATVIVGFSVTKWLAIESFL